MARRKLYVIDGHGQIYRCYYAPFRPLTAPSGEPTRATFMFFQTLFNLLRDRRPDYLAMALDTSDETVFRRDLDPTYKANRSPPPEDLPPQIDRIVQILEAMGVPLLRRPGFEADDLIATVCERLKHDDVDVVIVSRDKDLDQLISDRVRLHDPLGGVDLDPDALFTLKGYRPEQAIDAQTLMGDSTDNVRGVDGVGPKKAAELLAKYGSLDNILANADALTPKLRERMREFVGRAPLVRQLVTLRRDVPMEFDLSAAALDRLSFDSARPIFKDLALTRLLEQWPTSMASLAPAAASSQPASSAEPPASSPAASLFDEAPVRVEAAHPRTRAILVDSLDELRKLAVRAEQAAVIAFDTETTSLTPADADLVGVSLSFEAGTGYYVPVRGIGTIVPIEAVRAMLGPALARPEIRKCGQNCKYDLGVLRFHDLPVAGVDFDSMVASFVLDSSRGSHGIDALARDLLGYTKIPTTDLIGRGKDQLRFDQLPTTAVVDYAAEDADIALRLRERLEPRLIGSPVERLFRELEMPLVEVLAEMEFNGIALDRDYLTTMGGEMAAEQAALIKRIHELVGFPFNVDSTKQLADVLFDHLKFPVIKRTRTARSTDAEVLEQLADTTDHPLPKLLLQYRELTKLNGTYVEPLPTMVSRRTGRVHPSFHQAVAVTGRLSCSDPNLQNIPIRTSAGARIRRAFVAGQHENVLLKADYSQIELRFLAHFSGDEELSRAFAAGEDIHAFVAGQVFDVPAAQVTKDQRARAKTVNFGIIYGQSAFGLARQTGMGRTEAQAFIDAYFRRYPKIRGFIDGCIAQARRHGCVETILGRRREIADIQSRNPTARAAAERFAVNTVVQGSAADLIKKAMIDIHRRLRRQPGSTRMLLQVHDELVFELPRASVATEAAAIRAEMSGAIPLRVPVQVDAQTGPNWLDMTLLV